MTVTRLARLIVFLVVATPGVSGGEAFGIVPRSEGRLVVYRARNGANAAHQLYLADAVTGAADRISGELTPGGEVLPGFLVDPVGRYVVYRADQDLNEQRELYRVDLTTGLVTRLNAPLAPGGDVGSSFQIDPWRGRFVVYSAGQDLGAGFANELYVADAHTGAVRRLNPPLEPGQHVASAPILDPRGRLAVYTIGRDDPFERELFATEIASGRSFEVHTAAPPGGSLESGPLVDDAGRNIVFTASPSGSPTTEVFRHEVATGRVTKLNAPLSPGDRAFAVHVDPEGRFAIYRTGGGPIDPALWHVGFRDGAVTRLTGAALRMGYLDGPSQLGPRRRWVAVEALVAQSPTDFGWALQAHDLHTGRVRAVSHPEATGVSVGSFRFDPRGRYVVYNTVAASATHSASGLFRHDLASGATTKMSARRSFGSFAIDPLSRFVVYRADEEEEGVDGLFRSEVSTNRITRLSGDMVQGGDVSSDWEIDATGGFVVYVADQDVDGRHELYRVDLSTGVVLKLSGDHGPGGDVSSES